MQTVKDLGVHYDGLGLDYFLNKDTAIPAEIARQIPGQTYTVFVAGGTYNTKRLSQEKMHELFIKSIQPLVILGDKKDNILVTAALQSVKNGHINLCGQLNLNQSIHILSNAARVISHDTGLMHIAAALKKPVISIWGNTVPEFGMGPFYPAGFGNEFNTISEVKNLSCRPCSKLGFQRCPKGHFSCMQHQDIDKITDALSP
jgi:ADP-heptose:LPS heptosyltransferase